MSRTLNPDTARSRAAAGGLVLFGAVMLIIAGALDLLRGIMAIAQDEIFVSTPDYVFQFDLTGWGWVQLVLGAVAIVVGAGLIKAALWARILGLVLAAVLIVVNFLTIPYYPLWSVVAIAFYAFVIWALCVVRPEDL